MANNGEIMFFLKILYIVMGVIFTFIKSSICYM